MYVCVCLCVREIDRGGGRKREKEKKRKRERKSEKETHRITNLQIIFHKRAVKYRSLLQKMTYKDKGSYESSEKEREKECMCVYSYRYIHIRICVLLIKCIKTRHTARSTLQTHIHMHHSIHTYHFSVHVLLWCLYFKLNKQDQMNK